MKLLCVVIAFILAFVIGQIIVLRLYLFSFKRRLFDPVDNRKIHAGLIPRLGGMAFLPTQCSIFLLIVVGLRHLELIQMEYDLLFRFMLLICGLGLLFVVGIIDDLMGIGYKWKFAAQVVAALLLPLSGLWIVHLDGLLGITVLPDWIGILLTVFIVVFITNAFNLIDGIDGLCSGLTILACTVLGALFFRHESWLPVVFAFITVGVLAPFFYYNVYGRSRRRRRIFMGDTGSMTLGLTVSFLVISYAVGDNELPVPGGNLLVAFSVVLVPMLDVIRVILLRLLSRKPLFIADKNHIHHYFLDLGFSKRTALFSILSIALGFIVLNMCIARFVYNNQTLILLLDATLWFAGLWLLGKVRYARIEKKGQDSNVEKIQDEN